MRGARVSAESCFIPHHTEVITHDTLSSGNAIPTSPGMMGGYPATTNVYKFKRETDIGEVRSRDELRLGITPDAGTLLHDPNEGFGGVGVSVDLPERLLVDRRSRVGVRRREHAADELDRGHREIDTDAVPAQMQLLLDLGGVAVSDRPEGTHYA